MDPFRRLAHSLARFLTTMDAKAATSLFVTAVLLTALILLFAFGQRWFDLTDEGAIEGVLASVAASRWAIAGVMAAFALLALVGVPQFLLIGVTVTVFGPREGAIYAWIATMASATLTFGVGHFLGDRWQGLGTSPSMRALTGFLERRGIIASALIRVVPSAPFIVVNAAAGAAHIPLWKYWAGSGVGIVPKIALVAALAAVAPGDATGSGGVAALLGGWRTRDILLVAAIVAVWLAFILGIRIVYVRLRGRDARG